MGKPHNVKIEPATPLPWKYTPQDARYLCHAANAYPKLVALLQAAVDDDADWLKDAIAILRELGESN